MVEAEGSDYFPHLYEDNLQTFEFSEWPQEALEGRVQEYTAFLNRGNLRPRAKETAERILTHALFELFWRTMAELDESQS